MRNTMKERQRFMTVGSAGLLMAATAVAAADGQENSNPNRFNVSARFMFNVPAKIRHLATPVNPGPGVGVPGANHVYDNGYVRRDDSYDPVTGRNAGDMTWNWGFSDPSQVAGNTLGLQTLSSPADNLTQRKSDDPQLGFEISYGRVLKTLTVGNTPVNVGVAGAFGMTFLKIRNNSTISGRATGVRDTYDMSGLPLIPTGPYAGSTPVAGGPLPLLLPDAPITRDPIDLPATAVERINLEGNLYGFKLGPFIEVPLSRSISMQLQAGFASMLVDGKFTWSESVSTGGAGAGSASKAQWCYGGFVEGQLMLSLNQHWSAFAGAGWQNLGNYSLGAGTKAVDLELENAISAFCGLSYSF